MRIRIITLMLISLILTACGKPVPNDKSEYIGEWQSKEMYLLILQDGTVAYKRLKNGGTTSVNGPLKEFIGNNFVVGFAFLTTTFEVAEAPKKVGNAWEMTVDGIQLTKIDE